MQVTCFVKSRIIALERFYIEFCRIVSDLMEVPFISAEAIRIFKKETRKNNNQIVEKSTDADFLQTEKRS